MHWNGKAWTKSGIPISANGAIGALYAVSANDVWAVGDTSGTITHPLLLHWNGHRWSRPAGVPSVAGALETVTVIGGDVWAAGEVSAGKYSYNPLVLHRTGSEWFIVPAPAADGLIFSGLAATARDSIWAIAATKAAVLPSVLLHWNGSAWRPASYPGQASQAHLYAVTAGPKGVVWAVGDYTRGNTTVPFSVRWTGKKWQLVVIPGPTTGTLFGVSPIPGGEAWAVGYRGRGLVSLRWDGKAWIPVPVPDDPSAFQLDAVSASSASNAWTLSYRFAGGGHPAGTMLIHWNGKTWT